METVYKALVVPYNDNKEILLQDRRGHNPPPWGFFGGGVEKGETNMQALIREIKEEMTIDLKEEEVEYLGEFEGFKEDGVTKVVLNVYLWKFDRPLTDIDLKEGAGYKYMTLDEAKTVLLSSRDVQIIAALERIW